MPSLEPRGGKTNLTLVYMVEKLGKEEKKEWKRENKLRICFGKMTQNCVGEMRKWFGEMTQFVGETTESVGERKQICWGTEAKLLGK